MKIGELAAAVGISREAIRFYEKMGLIQSQRQSNGYRHYDLATKEQIVFIKSAQNFGLSLAEIQKILPLIQGKQLSTQVVQNFVHKRLAMIDERIAALQAFKARFALLLSRSEHPTEMAYSCSKDHLLID